MSIDSYSYSLDKEDSQDSWDAEDNNRISGLDLDPDEADFLISSSPDRYLFWANGAILLLHEHICIRYSTYHIFLP